MAQVVLVFLLLSVLCFGAFAQVKFGQGADAPTNCGQLSLSCAKCLLSPLGCRYYWNAQGLYNTSTNGVCTTASDFLARRNNNYQNKTVFAFALLESEVQTTAGQRLLHTYNNSTKSYGAWPVTCFDRHLCCCRKMPPPPLNNLTVLALNVYTLQPVTTAQVGLQCTSGFQASGNVDSPRGGKDFFRVPVDDNCSASGNAPQYTYVNSTSPLRTGQGSSYTIKVYLAPAPCVFSVVVTSGGAPVPGANITFQGQTVVGLSDGTYNFGSFQAFIQQRVDASAAGYNANFNVSDCPSGATVVLPISLTPIPNQIRVKVVTQDFGSTNLVNRPGATVSISGPSPQSAQTTDQNGEFLWVGTLAAPLLPGAYFASGSYPGYTSVNNQAFPRNLGSRNDYINTTIILVQPPCITNIQVVDDALGTPIAGANVSVAVLKFWALSNASGFVPPQLLGSSGGNINVTASADGYEPGAFATFSCGVSGGLSTPNPVVVRLIKIVQFRIFGAERVAQTQQNPLAIGSLITQWFIQMNNDCSNYKLVDPRTVAIPIPGGGCYLFSGDLNVITLSSRAVTLQINITYREAFGFIAESGGRSLNFNLTYPNVTLTYTGLPYTVLFTPYEAVFNGSGSPAQTFLPSLIPAPPLDSSAKGITYPVVLGVPKSVGIPISSQQYYNPNSPADLADQASEALGLQNDQEAVSNGQVSFQLPPNGTYNSWRVQNLSPQQYYFRIGNNPVSGYSWDFLLSGPNQQAVSSPNTANGLYTFNFTLPNYPDFPWRKMPIFLPVKQQYMWVIIHSTPWDAAAANQQPNYPKGGTMKLSMSCSNGPTIAHSSDVLGYSDVLWPFFVPFSSKICSPQIQIPPDDYNFLKSGYYDPLLGPFTPSASFIPDLLSGSVTASEAELVKATGWQLTTNDGVTNPVSYSVVPTYKLQITTNFNWGNIYSRSFRNTKAAYVEFFYGVALNAAKKK